MIKWIARLLSRVLISIRPISKQDLWVEIDEFATMPAIGILFGGDRLTCCDEVLAAYAGSTFLGVVTLSSEGETLSGEPAIVGLWVHYDHRGEGVGSVLLTAAVKRMAKRGLVPVSIIPLSSKVLGMLEKLPPNLRKQVKVEGGFTAETPLSGFADQALDL